MKTLLFLFLTQVADLLFAPYPLPRPSEIKESIDASMLLEGATYEACVSAAKVHDVVTKKPDEAKMVRNDCERLKDEEYRKAVRARLSELKLMGR